MVRIRQEAQARLRKFCAAFLFANYIVWIVLAAGVVAALLRWRLNMGRKSNEERIIKNIEQAKRAAEAKRQAQTDYEHNRTIIVDPDGNALCRDD